MLEHDKERTLKNRERLFLNKNLLYWYKNLYKTQFLDIEELSKKKILEIGSGASALKHFYGHVLTSDILGLDYLDHQIDCQKIDRCLAIPDSTLDIITMTNVLHHLQDPIACLKKMSFKLKPGGSVIMAEPYYSYISRLIYKYIHSEPSVFDIERPVIKDIRGPLSSANIAIPYMLFFSDKGWDRELLGSYDFSKNDVKHYSSFSYMATGGMSMKIPIPHFLYKVLFWIDIYIAKTFPGIFSSFFIIKLVKR